MSGGGEGAVDAAVEGDEFAVEEGEETGLGAVAGGGRAGAGGHQRAGGGVGGLGRVVEEELVEAVQDVGDVVALAGEQPQPGPGQTDDDGGLGALALDVADGEAPAAVPGGEEVVEVAARSALVAGFVDEGAAHAGDLRDGAGQQSALQDGADGGLAGVLPGGPDGERDPPPEVLHEAGDLVGEPVDPAPSDHQRAQRASAGDEPVGEGGAGSARGVECSVRPRVGGGAGLERVARGRWVPLQGTAQVLDAVLTRVPDAGEAEAAGPAAPAPAAAVAGGPVLQPHRAPVGQPRHDQLPGEGGDQVLVELPGEQVGGLGEEGQGAAPQPGAVPAGPAGEPVVAVRAAAAGVTGGTGRFPVAGRASGGRRVECVQRVGGGLFRPGRLRREDLRHPQVVRQRALPCVRLDPVARRAPPGGQSRPHRLRARTVGDPPGLGERGDEAQAAPVLRGLVRRRLRLVAARRAGGVPVGDLDDERAGRLLQPARQTHLGAGVHDGVGDEFAGDQRGVVADPAGEVFGAGRRELRPLGERLAQHGACGARREGAPGQGRVHPHALPRAGGARGGLPLGRNGPHGQLPGQLVRRELDRCRQGDRPDPPISTESPK
ncbi:hypothetical protein GCM10023238_28050 [Streptomyces heliomycini]